MGICLDLCMCTTYMPGAHKVQKSVSDTLELALGMAVSHQVGVGNQTWVLCKCNKYS